jgi:hypothetical protein
MHLHVEQAEFKHSEQAARASTNNQDVGFDRRSWAFRLWQGRMSGREAENAAFDGIV